MIRTSRRLGLFPRADMQFLSEKPRSAGAGLQPALNSQHAPGRYNIPSVGLYVWRLRPYSVTQAPAYCVDRARNHYTFSVLGNNCPLVVQPREQGEETGVASELDVPTDIER